MVYIIPNTNPQEGDMMKNQDVENTAILSRLEISEAQVKQYQRTLNTILEYVDKLNEIDTKDVEPTVHALPLKNVLRKDEVVPSLPKEMALLNSPEQENGYLKVAKIMED